MKVRVQHWWPPTWTAVWLPIVEERANATIEEEVVTRGRLTKLKTQLAAGTAPDVIQLDTRDDGEFFAKDIFVPFDDVLASSGLDSSRWAVDLGDVSYKGHVLGLELFVNQGHVGYLNVDRIQQAGFPIDELPLWGTPVFDTWKWSDFVEFLKAVTIKNADGTYEQYGIDSAYGSPEYLQMHMATYGAHLLDDPTGFEPSQVFPDMDVAIAAAHDLVDLYLVHGVAPDLDTQTGVKEGLFRANRAVVNFWWAVPDRMEWGAPFRIEPIQKPFAKQRMFVHGANHWCINKESKVVAKGQECSIVMATDYEVGAKFLATVAVLPPYDPARFLSLVKDDSRGTLFRTTYARLAGVSQCAYCLNDVFMWKRGYGLPGQFLANTLSAELQSALLRQKTVEEALRDAKDVIDAEIKTLRGG